MKSFNEIYEEIYKENFEELEALRKDKTKKAAIITGVAFLGIFLIMILFINSQISMLFLPWIIIVNVIMILIFTSTNNRKYKRNFKQKAIEPLIKNIDKNLKYNPNVGFPPMTYRQGEFEEYDNYYTEDGIVGLLDGKYKVQMAEVHTESEHTDSEGNTYTTTIFHGIFGNVQCAKDIKTTLKIHSDKGILGKLFKGKTKIEMDSDEFEKYFDVYGDNKIIAMQILTSDVMEMMISFRNESKIKYEMTIKNNQIYIRFHTEPVFEPKAFRKSLDYNMLKEYYDIIDFVFKVSRAINNKIENTDI